MKERKIEIPKEICIFLRLFYLFVIVALSGILIRFVFYLRIFDEFLRHRLLFGWILFPELCYSIVRCILNEHQIKQSKEKHESAISLDLEDRCYLYKERNYVIQTNFSLPFDSAHQRHTLNERSKCQHPPKKKLLKNRLCGVIICRIRVNNYIWMGNWMWMVFDHCNDTKTQLKQFSFSIGLNRLPRFVIQANDECFGNSEYCRHI